jgi:hypothetical protein
MFEFEREVNLINDCRYQEFVRDYFEHSCPKYFWEIGASSSGKYHPKFSQGEGGLVRHTKAVVMFAEELLKLSSYAYMPKEYRDFVIMACILHDTCKYGVDEFDKAEYKNHAENASINVDKAWRNFFEEPAPYLLLNAIRSHMGQWSTNRDDRPFTQIDRCVHMADYVASRNFIDIPELAPDTEHEE